MLFHSLQDPQSGAYVNQLRADIEGVDVMRFQAAWQAVFERHAVLRSGFLSEQGFSTAGAVAREPPLRFAGTRCLAAERAGSRYVSWIHWHSPSGKSRSI